jgi:hypothetical protein
MVRVMRDRLKAGEILIADGATATNYQEMLAALRRGRSRR